MSEILFFFQDLVFAGSNMFDTLVVQAAVQAVDKNIVMGVDMSIEGLRSQKYSTGIFVFLIVSLVFFSMIIYFYMPKGENKLKRGEKIMFGAIIAGVFLAIAIGWLELIDGYLI